MQKAGMTALPQIALVRSIAEDSIDSEYKILILGIVSIRPNLITLPNRSHVNGGMR